jgi:phosphoglycerol transferase MdoB-like AlkP superfamily enzyme
MKLFILKFLKYWLFWLLLFAFFRLIFIFAYLTLAIPEIGSAREALFTFYYALKLDLSMAGYLVSIPMIISCIWLFFQKKWLSKTIDYITILFIIIYSFISFGEIGIYNEWRTKLNYKALLYFQHPQEIFNSISTGTFILLLIGVILLIAGWIWVYLKYYRFTKSTFSTQWYYKVIFIILTPIFTFYFIRGGFLSIPISQSQSWFSKNQTLNDASVNVGWNIFQNMIDMQSLLHGNPFQSYPNEIAQKTVADIHKVEKDTTINVLKLERPNVVLILLESWSADLVGALGDTLNITPNFDKLAKEGILFTNLYSSGNRSQQGMASIFSGFPALPITTITEHPEKYRKLPSLTQILNKAGYRSSFYFGGQLIYGNIKSYIMYNQFAKIVEGEDFNSSIPRGKLGVHDEFLFNRNIEDLKTEPQPFFSAMFTMSSHSPYDQPIQNKITKDVPEKEFVNSAWYTDYALGKYFDQARKQPWFNNTLFILVADHSHVSHQQHGLQTFEYHRIPLLLYGSAIKPAFQGVKMDKIASQTDIPATLLKQLNIDASKFPWSKNLFNPYSPEFAFFEMNDGLGWKRPSGYYVYNKRENQFLDKKLNPNDEEKVIREGKSYLQEVFRQFLDF